ncbi:MAG: histidine phosphatase family protein, partial [Bryocella sp.]
GTRAETFSELLKRTETALKKLEALDGEAPVLLFTHGHFMQAMRHTLRWPQWSPTEKMLNFREYDEKYRVLNTELLRAEWDPQQKWRLK